MTVIQGFLVSLTILLGLSLFFKILMIHDTINIFVKRYILGRRIVFIKPLDENAAGWYSEVYRDPMGHLAAWRYPGTSGGYVSLKNDHTGYYHGDVKWINV
jgi:hypothetical protein